MVRERNGQVVDIEWRPFSLEQVHQTGNEAHKAWEVPEDKIAPSVWGLRAGIAAQRQGKELGDQFIHALLSARHQDRKDLGDLNVLVGVAREVGLQVQKFEEDLNDRDILGEIAISHMEAVETYGVFGTPTFVFPNGGSAFLKMLKPGSLEEASRSYDMLLELMENQLIVGEIKRPQPPWPQNI